MADTALTHIKPILFYEDCSRRGKLEFSPSLLVCGYGKKLVSSPIEHPD
jgi:hypothetical protein